MKKILKNCESFERVHTSILENRKGITLISLVVTIIILLILAGISIKQLVGNGLFEKARLAKEKQENAAKLENTILENYENEIDNYGSIGSTRNENINLNYSTTEKQVGTWIDGSPIYQITRFYDNNGEGYGVGENILENIKETLNANIVIDYKGFMTLNSYSFSDLTEPIPDTNSGIYCDNGNLRLNLQNTAKTWKIYLTIQYMKNNN